VSETSKTTMDLPMNCEIFKCLKLPIQKKFIWGLGRDIYGMFGQKLLKKVCIKLYLKYKGKNDMYGISHTYCITVFTMSWHFDVV
jgi:hypothetical protein